jgi:hypothetical protein
MLPLVPVFPSGGIAQYRFDWDVQGFTVTFPIEFIKENGV